MAATPSQLTDLSSIKFDTNIMLLQTLSYFEHDLIHDLHPKAQGRDRWLQAFNYNFNVNDTYLTKPLSELSSQVGSKLSPQTGSGPPSGTGEVEPGLLVQQQVPAFAQVKTAINSINPMEIESASRPASPPPSPGPAAQAAAPAPGPAAQAAGPAPARTPITSKTIMPTFAVNRSLYNNLLVYTEEYKNRYSLENRPALSTATWSPPPHNPVWENETALCKFFIGCLAAELINNFIQSEHR